MSQIMQLVNLKKIARSDHYEVVIKYEFQLNKVAFSFYWQLGPSFSPWTFKFPTWFINL